jgi:hypothetical protein
MFLTVNRDSCTFFATVAFDRAFMITTVRSYISLGKVAQNATLARVSNDQGAVEVILIPIHFFVFLSAQTANTTPIFELRR